MGGYDNSWKKNNSSKKKRVNRNNTKQYEEIFELVVKNNLSYASRNLRKQVIRTEITIAELRLAWWVSKGRWYSWSIIHFCIKDPHLNHYHPTVYERNPAMVLDRFSLCTSALIVTLPSSAHAPARIAQLFEKGSGNTRGTQLLQGWINVVYLHFVSIRFFATILKY